MAGSPGGLDRTDCLTNINHLPSGRPLTAAGSLASRRIRDAHCPAAAYSLTCSNCRRSTMSQFLRHAVEDMRAGRESWRVLTLFSILAFALSTVLSIIRNLPIIRHLF